MEQEKVIKEIENVVIVKNGVPFNDNEYINVNVTPTDVIKRYYLEKDFAKQIIEDIPSKYRDHVVTIEKEYSWYRLILEDGWRHKFDKEKLEYENRKLRMMRRM
jgi:hypothetical protein